MRLSCSVSSFPVTPYFTEKCLSLAVLDPGNVFSIALKHMVVSQTNTHLIIVAVIYPAYYGYE